MLLILITTQINIVASAQTISGFWEGNIAKGYLTASPNKIVIKIFLYNDTIISGTSHFYYDNRYEHYTIRGIYHQNDSTIFFEEKSVIGVKVGGLNFNCLGNYSMKLSINDSTMKLYGKWRNNKSRAIFKCPTSEVWFEKPLYHKSNAEPYFNRFSDVQHFLELNENEKDSIKLEIFDDEQTDNDVISIYANDNCIVKNQIISSIPTTLYLPVKEKETSVSLKVVAESLGYIPPCTPQIIITTKSTRHILNLSSDYTNNGIIELFFKDSNLKKE